MTHNMLEEWTSFSDEDTMHAASKYIIENQMISGLK
jgi:hypothetical protein